MATFDMPVPPVAGSVAGSVVGTGINEESRQKSLGELFGDLTRETATLVRQEVTLAKAEITQKASRMGKEVGLAAAGGMVAYAGFLVLLMGIALGLVQLGMASWVAYVAVGCVAAIIGGVLAMQGINGLKHIDPVPHQTVETLKDDVRWAKNQSH